MEMGFGAGGGFGDGFSAGNHGLFADQGMGQQPDLRVPAPYGMDKQTVLPDYGVPVPFFQPIDTFPIPTNPGVLIMGNYNGLQERADFSGHQGLPPHMNYDVQNLPGWQSRKGLGEAHAAELFNTGMNESIAYMQREQQTFLKDWMK